MRFTILMSRFYILFQILNCNFKTNSKSNRKWTIQNNTQYNKSIFNINKKRKKNLSVLFLHNFFVRNMSMSMFSMFALYTVAPALQNVLRFKTSIKYNDKNIVVKVIWSSHLSKCFHLVISFRWNNWDIKETNWCKCRDGMYSMLPHMFLCICSLVWLLHSYRFD